MTEPDDDTVPLHEAVRDMSDSEMILTQTHLLARIDQRLELLVENVGRLGTTETAQQPTDAGEAQSPSQTPDQDDESTQSSAVGDDRERIYDALSEMGVDIEGVSVVNIPGKQHYKIVADDVDADEGSPWREWTNEHFGRGRPGSIQWAEFERDDGSTGNYPEAFILPYTTVEEVLG